MILAIWQLCIYKMAVLNVLHFFCMCCCHCYCYYCSCCHKPFYLLLLPLLVHCELWEMDRFYVVGCTDSLWCHFTRFGYLIVIATPNATFVVVWHSPSFFFTGTFFIDILLIKKIIVALSLSLKQLWRKNSELTVPFLIFSEACKYVKRSYKTILVAF